jgi:hypothetical protein
VDVGPTSDLSPDGRPTTDNQLEFEDLMMVSLNYGVVSAPQGSARPPRARTSESGPDRVILGAPGHVTAGETFSVPLTLEAHGALQGISVALGWNSMVARPLEVRSDHFFESSGGVVFPAGPAAVDGALLGMRETGLTGAGAFATVMFLALTTGDPAIDLDRARARDRNNHELPLVVTSTTSATQQPLRTRFAPARPTPFGSYTTLEYELASGGQTELAVFAIDGRRIRTLARGQQPTGIHRFTWDGTDEQGNRIKAGVYFARLITDGVQFKQTLVLVR